MAHPNNNYNNYNSYEWTVTLCLNRNHSIAFPVKLSLICTKENVITNWQKVSKCITQKCVNKFRKHGVNKKKLMIFTQKGSDLSEIQNQSDTLDLQTLENDHFIFDGCKFYVSKQGDALSFIPESDITKLKRHEKAKDKATNEVFEDLLMIRTVAKANLLRAIVIGKKGQKIRDIIGTSGIEAAVIFDNTKHNPSKKKDFLPPIGWKTKYEIIETVDAQTIIIQANQSATGDDLKNNGDSLRTPLQHAFYLGKNGPFIMMRGKRDNLIKAVGMLNVVKRYFLRVIGTENVHDKTNLINSRFTKTTQNKGQCHVNLDHEDEKDDIDIDNEPANFQFQMFDS